MAMPTFIGIGAQKCASTWLFEILRDHPEVVLSDPKEIDFFSYQYHYGRQWYQRHFSGTGAAIGEISPSYFHEPAVPERVRQFLPEARILLSLRNPVERAFSNHKHEVRLGHFAGDDLSFEAGLENNPSYVEQGLYATHLSRWLRHFPPEQMLVLIYEDIVAEPCVVARRVFEFLSIAPDHEPAALHQRSNESYVNRYSGLEHFRGSAKQTLERLGLGELWRVAANTGLKQLYAQVNRVPAEQIIPPMSAESRDRLGALFANEVLELEGMLGRTLPDWH
jgi:hypothetical protein